MTGIYRWNRRLRVLLTAGLIAGLTAGCNGNTVSRTIEQTGEESGNPDSSEAGGQKAEGLAEDVGLDLEFTARDLDVGYEETTAVAVRFQGETVTSDGEGASVTGTTVTIDREGTYVISGESYNGRIIVNGEDTDKIQLVFDGLTLHCPDNSPVYIKNGDKVFLTLKEGTENALSDGNEYQLSEEDQAVDAVIYSKADFTVNGSGALNITASCNHGIVSKDDLVITGGKVTVTAEGKGLYGKDCVKIKDGTFVLNTGGDGIQSDNAEEEGRGFVYIAGGSFDITALKDGIQAETVLRIDDGEFKIVSGQGAAAAPAKEEEGMFGGRAAGPPDGSDMPMDQGSLKGRRSRSPAAGGQDIAETTADTTADTITDATTDATTDAASEESQKGLKAGSALILNGGGYEVDAADDSIHSNGTVTVSGGSYTLNTGDDGIHGEGAVVINGGEISIQQCYEGIEGLSVTIAEGTIFIGASDDGINAADGSSTSGMERNCFIKITGGNITITSSADGIDSNGDFYMDGGTVMINGPESGRDGALDYDGSAVITGGSFIAAGSSGMAQGFSDSSAQNSILYGLDSWVEAGDTIRLTDESGSVLAEFIPEKRYNSVVISVPELELNKTYVLEAGEQRNEITITSVVTSNVTSAPRQMGGMGDRALEGSALEDSGKGGRAAEGNAPEGSVSDDIGKGGRGQKGRGAAGGASKGSSKEDGAPGSGAPGSGAPGSGAPGSGAPGSGAPGSAGSDTSEPQSQEN